MNHRSGLAHPDRANGWGPVAWQRHNAASINICLLLCLVFIVDVLDRLVLYSLLLLIWNCGSCGCGWWRVRKTGYVFCGGGKVWFPRCYRWRRAIPTSTMLMLVIINCKKYT